MTDIERYNPIEGEVDFIDISGNQTHIVYQLVNLLNFLVLNCFPFEFLEQYKSFLSEIGFRCCGEHNSEKTSGHYRQRRYEHKSIIAYDQKPLRVSLFLHPIPLKNGFIPRTGITSKIWYPTRDIIGKFLEFFSPKQIPKIKEIECTFDFYSVQREALFNFVNLHKVMKYNRGKPFNFKGTSYPFKKEKGKRYSKDMRTYSKDMIKGDPVRMEVILNKPIITSENLKLTLPTLDNQLQNLDFKRFVNFRAFDMDHFRGRWTERDRRKHFKKGFLKYYRKRWTIEQHKGLSQVGLGSFEYCLLFENDDQQRSIEGIIYELKQRNENVNEFVDDLKFNDVFHGSIKGRSFLL